VRVNNQPVKTYQFSNNLRCFSYFELCPTNCAQSGKAIAISIKQFITLVSFACVSFEIDASAYVLCVLLFSCVLSSVVD